MLDFVAVTQYHPDMDYAERHALAERYQKVLERYFPGVYVRPYQGEIDVFMLPDEDRRRYANVSIHGLLRDMPSAVVISHSYTDTRKYYHDVWLEATGQQRVSVCRNGKLYERPWLGPFRGGTMEEKDQEVPGWVGLLGEIGEIKVKARIDAKLREEADERGAADYKWASFHEFLKKDLTRFYQFVDQKRPEHFHARWDGLDAVIRIPGHSPILACYKFAEGEWQRDNEILGENTPWHVVGYEAVDEEDHKKVVENFGRGESATTIEEAIALARRYHKESAEMLEKSPAR